MGTVSIIILILAIAATTEALNCNVLNTIPGIFTQTCPGNIYSCMKFTCKIKGGGQQIYKGCNDPGNPQVACNTLQNTCSQMGGTGQCYTCNFDMCNSSFSALTFFSIILSLLFCFYSF